MDNKPIYKTAAELGIEQWEHDGLVALIGPLSRGKLDFDMSRACGSVCCIGGWLAAQAGIDQRKYMSSRYGTCGTSLFNLFWPNRGIITDCVIYDATSPQAARAIVNFLVTGDPKWDAVMAEA